MKDFRDFTLIPETEFSEFDSIYTKPNYFINNEFGTVADLELIIEKRKVFSIHFKSTTFTNRERIKYHFDKVLINKGRTKDSISDFYYSRDEKPIYAYISYFGDQNLFHYTDQLQRVNYRETQAKEINDKHKTDLKKYLEKKLEK